MAAGGLMANSCSVLLPGEDFPLRMLDPLNNNRGALEYCSWGARGDGGFGDGAG